MSPDIFGNPLLFERKKQVEKKTTKPKELKRKIFTDDFYKLMDRQKNMCASKDCKKHNGVRQPVTTIRDIDHIYPIKLWELKGKKGNANDLSNLQLLCPNCHRLKTAEDRKKIALYREKIKTNKKTTDTKKPSGKNPSKGKTTYQTKYYNAITGKWENLHL